MADIVLVPGSWHGGWYFSPIVPALRDAGHNVFPVTPTGVGDRRHLTSGAINLDTHIQDVVNTFEIEGIDDAVLVGHSYGGMVITGVSSRLPGRIRSLVYLDALLPQDGQSAWDLIIEPVRRKYLATTEDGLTHIPPPELGKRVTPHPLATYFQPFVWRRQPSPCVTRCMSGRKTIRKAARSSPSITAWPMPRTGRRTSCPTVTTSSRRRPPSSWPSSSQLPKTWPTGRNAADSRHYATASSTHPSTPR